MTKELYLEDSYLKSCEVEVVQIDENRVMLNQTVFYPEGGGQEYDTGTIVQNGQTFDVYKVKRESGKIAHYIHHPEELTLGPATTEINWTRRENLMRYHTMLHVLAAVCNKTFGSLCTGNQIYEDKARIDLTVLSGLSKEELIGVIEEANKEIDHNHAVTMRVLPREEAEAISGAIKTVVNLIPKTVKEIRLVKIGDIDEQACGGTHVKATKEIGQIKLTNSKNKGKGVTRLELTL